MTGIEAATKDEADVSTPAVDRPATWYRPHLDGLRTVAVYLVVAFHAGADRFAGGFIGVDVFFVLSGYLVTQMLTRDMAGAGGVRFGSFYARRIRRLLPASVLMLVIVAIAYSAVAPPGEAFAARGGFQASFLYVSNWYFIAKSTGYFAEAVDQSPVLHMWSLAVEEQFYIVWPLLLGGAFWLGRRLGGARPVVVVRTIVALGAASSLVWALVAEGSNPDRAYYGTDTRAYQLLAGALLALSPGLIGRFRRRVPSRSVPAGAVAAALVLLVAVASSVVEVGPITRGVLATVLTLVIIAGLELRSGSLAGRFLSAGPMVYLGRISYGTYLWHWPVIVIASIVVAPSPLSMVAISAVLATALAALSAQLVETPIRRSPRLERRTSMVIAVGLAVGVAGAVVVIPRVLSEPPAQELAVTSSASFTPIPDDLPLARVSVDRYGETTKCRGKEPTACTIVDGPGEHVMLMGDSNAQMWIPAFEAMARAKGLRLSLAVTSGCPWQRGIYPNPQLSPDCPANKEDAYERVIPALAPDLLVLVNAHRAGTSLGTNDPVAVSAASLDQLAVPGRKILMLEPLEGPPEDEPQLECLRDSTYLEDCRFVVTGLPSSTDRLYAEVATGREAVAVADPQLMACPYAPICDPVIGGIVVWWDHKHLALAYTSSLGDELASLLESLDLLEPQD